MLTNIYYVAAIVFPFVVEGIAFIWAYATLTNRVKAIEEDLKKLEDSGERLARLETSVEYIKSTLDEIKDDIRSAARGH